MQLNSLHTNLMLDVYMGRKKDRSQKAKSQAKQVAQMIESPDVSDSLPPLEEFGDLSSWAQGEDEDSSAREEVEVTPGTTKDEVDRPKHYGKFLLILLVLFGFLAWVAGVVERKGLVNVLNSISPGRTIETTLVEARDGTVLMLETNGKLSQIVAQVPGQASWYLISKDDTTATNPALSPDANLVAYLSAREEVQIAIVSLSNEEQYHITSEQAEQIGMQALITEVNICPWTTVAWSPDSHRVAFFGCRKNPPLSLAFVADISGPEVVLSTIAESEFDTAAPRQLEWSGPTQVTIVTPSADVQQVGRVKTLSVP
jgi:hypothetical protein